MKREMQGEVSVLVCGDPGGQKGGAKLRGGSEPKTNSQKPARLPKV